MRTISAIALLLFVSVASAQMTDVTRETTGHGLSYERALNSALLHAVQQVRGAKVGTSQSVDTVFSQVITNGSIITAARSGQKQNIYNESSGWVKSFKILSTHKPKNKNDSWTVKVQVVVPHFKSDLAANDARKTLVVAPFVMANAHYSVNSHNYSAATVKERILNRLMAQFAQNGRFALVNRNHSDAIGSELRLLDSKYVSAEQASRLGQISGADLIIVGTIEHLGKPEDKREFYGSDFNQNRLSALVSYTLVEVASQRVAWADVVKVEAHNGHNFTANDFFNKIARVIANKATRAIYPIRIMDVVGNDLIYLSQGGQAVKKGDLLAVMGPGRKMKDPDIGQVLMVQGPQVAKLEVTDVKAKYSVAKLVDGDARKFKASSVVEPIEGAASKASNKPKTPGSSEKPISWD